ncbi:hypothetical protein niasHT_010428 [Heterodera trifolii]|uniref:Fido domain-containing protein n=1 Tax=Heterodera trifolii TaxID=157864 RepID=A0ABD2MC28_9BILA
MEQYVGENSPFQYDEVLLRTLKERDDLIQNKITIEVLHDLHQIAFQSQEPIDFRKHNVQEIGEALEKAETKEFFTKKPIIFHLHFLDVHPFGDATGRTSRLLLNLLFLKKSIPTVVIPDSYWLRYQEAIGNFTILSDENPNLTSEPAIQLIEELIQCAPGDEKK